MILRSMIATRGMFCRSLLIDASRRRRITRHQIDDRIGLLVADLDQHRAARRQAGRAEIDDLADVAEAVFAGDQRRAGSYSRTSGARF